MEWEQEAPVLNPVSYTHLDVYKRQGYRNHLPVPAGKFQVRPQCLIAFLRPEIQFLYCIKIYRLHSFSAFFFSFVYKPRMIRAEKTPSRSCPPFSKSSLFQLTF